MAIPETQCNHIGDPLPATPRVLFAVFQTGNMANGGVESISQVIDSIDSQCVVVTQLETPVNGRWEQAGQRVEILRLPYRVGDAFGASSIGVKLRRMWSIVRTNWITMRLIRKYRLQLLHCNDPAPFWHVVPAAILTRTPVVLNLRDTIAANETSSGSKYRLKFRLSDVVLVLSNEMASFYRQLVGESAIKKAKVQIQAIYSIVDLDRLREANPALRHELRAARNIAIDTVAIGLIAAFNDKKNQLEFIQQAGPDLQNRIPAARVFFVGDFRPEQDRYAESCLAATDSLKLQDCLTFAGFTDEIEAWYQSLDLVIVPTRKEGMARCMIEALACGTPVVSFDVCSANEILTRHDCGIVVPQGDYRALVDAILKLVHDDDERTRMGKNGYAVARKLFRRDDILSQYKALYGRVATAESPAFRASREITR